MLGLASQQEGDMRDRMIRDALTHIQTLETAIEAIMLGVRHVCEGTGAEPPSDSMPAPQRPVAARGWGASARPTAGTIKSGPIFGLNDTVEIPPGYDPKATQPGMALKDGVVDIITTIRARKGTSIPTPTTHHNPSIR
jgi:hypothetical protein